MQFLKNLFGGGGAKKEELTVYVQPKMCNEILLINVHLTRELSQTDDFDGYWVRKVASATRCPFEAEVTLYFDKNRKLVDQQITNGAFVTEADYQSYIDNQNA